MSSNQRFNEAQPIESRREFLRRRRRRILTAPSLIHGAILQNQKQNQNCLGLKNEKRNRGGREAGTWWEGWAEDETETAAATEAARRPDFFIFVVGRFQEVLESEAILVKSQCIRREGEREIGMVLLGATLTAYI